VSEEALIKGSVFDIRRYSIHDGPGIRTTVFFKGCPLSCWWCHNPEGQARTTELFYRKNRCIRCGVCMETCPQGAISLEGGYPVTDKRKCVICGSCVASCYADARETVGQEMEVDDVVAVIDRDVPFYEESAGGATFSGGEPLMQPEFLLGLLRACKEKGIHTAVDTCGLASWETFEDIRKYVDLFMYDLKLVDGEEHRKFTGVSNDLILSNLETLSLRGHKIVLRVPVIPGINDDDEAMREIGRLAASLPHLDAVCLLPYHRIGLDKYARLDRTYSLSETRPPSAEKMAEITDLLSRFGLCIRTGG